MPPLPGNTVSCAEGTAPGRLPPIAAANFYWAVGTAQHMLIRGLIEREGSADRFTLTDQGRAVLEVLIMKAATRGH